MTLATLTPDGAATTTIRALADLLGVNPGRIRQWRDAEGAPADLSLAAWREWLLSTRRAPLADRLIVVDPSAVIIAPAPAGPSPEIDKSEADRRRAVAQARLAELEQAEAERRVLPIDEVAAAIRALAAGLVEQLTTGIWTDLAPALEACTPDQRRAIRAAHDRAVLRLRAAAAHAGRDRLLALTQEPKP